MTIRTIILATAAVAGLALSPAVAEPMPVEYVRICSSNPNLAVVPGSEDPEECVDLRNGADGTALALALPGATIAPGKTFGVGVNIGTFGGETAIGISGSVQATDGLTLNGALGVGSAGSVGGRAGANFSW